MNLDRVTLLENIDKLIKEIDQTKGTEKIKLERQLAKLRKELTTPRRKQKIESLICKGPDLTSSDINYSRDNGVTIKQLAKITETPLPVMRELIKGNGKSRETKKKAAINLLKSTEMKVSEIAKKLELPTTAVYYLKRKLKED
ncbi:hypothetical protein [Amphibacillus jilinensis]|uniref:hypothetical protein n=1 Tax=Amphibacillus jilinensis TaxID=1216008 RepID=UPI0002FA2BD4|nr:hypothetical protein [Amphibacillus jilinensis]